MPDRMRSYLKIEFGFTVYLTNQIIYRLTGHHSALAQE